MDKVHSRDWYRRVHATTWVCDIGHHQEVFSAESDWKDHMRDLKLHRTPPTELQLKALSIQKQKRGERGEYQCPFCENVPEEISKLRGRVGRSAGWNILMKHIGDHVKSLSLIALPTTGVDGAESADFQDSQRRLRKTGSNASLPSGASSLAQISLHFADPPERFDVQLPSSKLLGQAHELRMPSSIMDQTIPELDESFNWDYVWETYPSGSRYRKLAMTDDSIIQDMIQHMIIAQGKQAMMSIQHCQS